VGQPVRYVVLLLLSALGLFTFPSVRCGAFGCRVEPVTGGYRCSRCGAEHDDYVPLGALDAMLSGQPRKRADRLRQADVERGREAGL
jgi:hypothetical protein